MEPVGGQNHLKSLKHKQPKRFYLFIPNINSNSISLQNKRPQNQLSYKNIRPEMLLSVRIEHLSARKIFKNCLTKKVDSISKNLMGKKGLTGI